MAKPPKNGMNSWVFLSTEDLSKRRQAYALCRETRVYATSSVHGLLVGPVGVVTCTPVALSLSCKERIQSPPGSHLTTPSGDWHPRCLSTAVTPGLLLTTEAYSDILHRQWGIGTWFKFRPTTCVWRSTGGMFGQGLYGAGEILNSVRLHVHRSVNEPNLRLQHDRQGCYPLYCRGELPLSHGRIQSQGDTHYRWPSASQHGEMLTVYLQLLLLGCCLGEGLVIPVSYRSPYRMSLWRNWLARSAVNRKVGGSSPPRDAAFSNKHRRRYYKPVQMWVE